MVHSHALLTPDHLDCHFASLTVFRLEHTFPVLAQILGFDDAREHPLAEIRLDQVPSAIEHFAKDDLVVTFSIVKIVRQKRRIRENRRVVCSIDDLGGDEKGQ